MVLSMGWNPFYGNTKKSFETHIIHKFDQDFYGSQPEFEESIAFSDYFPENL